MMTNMANSLTVSTAVLLAGMTAPALAGDSFLDLEPDLSFSSSEPIVETVQEQAQSTSFIIVGDMNGDGSLNNSDISPFVTALTNPGAYATEYPGLDADYIGDFNGDDILGNGDIAGFLQSIKTGDIIQKLAADSTVTTAPTPTALGAGVAALIALGTRRRRRSI